MGLVKFISKNEFDLKDSTLMNFRDDDKIVC